MLHSLQYYACCYALLCLLHQQQRAAALTIIIDGATTNEWATRDEYKRMLEASNEQETSLSQQLQQQQQQLQEQQEQLDYQPPPPPPPLSSSSSSPSSSMSLSLPMQIKLMAEREASSASTREHICGQYLVDTIELVCAPRGGVYSPPSIVQPTIKTKRASRQRAISPATTSSSSFQSSQQQQQPRSVSLSSSSLPRHLLHSSLSSQQPPRFDQPDSDYPVDGNGGSADAERAAPDTNSIGRGLQQQQQQFLAQQRQLEAELPSHLTIGGGGGGSYRGQTATDNNNDGDIINVNPLINKPRNKYNRMVLSRRLRGVSHECCKLGCSTDDLKAYCMVQDP